jgi:phospholipase/carboxylesterase
MMLNKETESTCIEIESGPAVRKSIIWLHGLGADGNDFVSMVPELQHYSLPDIRFIFPHAPIMPVTINNGNRMRAWFDVYGFTPDAKIDKEGIAQSVLRIRALIEREIKRGIAAHNIVLAGFSQGAVMALASGITYDKHLAGIIALSGFLPHVESLLQNATAVNRTTPIFIAHGTEDHVVPYVLGKLASANLKRAGYNVTWKSYDMAHSVCAEEVAAIGEWLQQVAFIS